MRFSPESLKKQIRISGEGNIISEKESDDYFSSRPRNSQVGAWASKQSEILESRDHLLARLKTFEEKYDGETIPRPSHWSGNRIAAKKIEFWEDGEFRLHDRFIFERQSIDGTWIKARLYP